MKAMNIFLEILPPKTKLGRFFVYILECQDKTLYCGATNNLVRRLAEHNRGVAAKYTRGRTPVKLVYFEQHKSLAAVRRREAEIKRLSRQQKSDLLKSGRKHLS